jgi:hypothetical protein
MGETQDAPCIAHRQVSGLNEIDCNIGAGVCRFTLSDLGLIPRPAGSPHLLLKIPWQFRFDPDVEGIRRDIEEERDRVARHGLSLLQPPSLGVDAS